MRNRATLEVQRIVGQRIGNGTPMSERPIWDGIEGIVFDAVGTLIKPVPSVAEAYTAAARRQGVELETRGGPGTVSASISRATRSTRSRGCSRRTRRPSAAAGGRSSTSVLPEVARPRPGVRRALGPFQPARSRGDASRTSAPALKALQHDGDLGLRRLEFRRPAPRGRARPARAGALASIRWSSRRKSASESHIRRSFRPPATTSACRRSGCSAWATTCENDVRGCDPRGPVRAACSTAAPSGRPICRMCRT